MDTILIPTGAKGLVFDLDGTVLHTMHHHWAAWKRVTKENDLEFSLDRLKALAGKPSYEIFAILCKEQNRVNINLKAVVTRKTELYCELAIETETIGIVMDIAKQAKQQGLPIAIATGGNKKSVMAALEAAQLLEFFDAIVTADDITPGNGKPHPETFSRAAQAINVAPEWCVGYEDAELGMQAIEAAGFLAAINVTKLEGYPHIHE
jgi:HAD superfamily hydrolase (TIGR01509 family)